MYALTVLCVLGLLAAVQVPRTSAFFFDDLWGSSSEEESEEVQGPRTGVSAAEQREIVNKHNELRRNVQPSASNMLKMRWNSEAAANAQAWADKCIMKHSPKNTRKLSNQRKCGENMADSSVRISWSKVIQDWYDEVKDWRYGVGSINGKIVGHFTQVVWYNSYEIGCGLAYCPNTGYGYHYVCQYCPAGNYQFSHPYKAGPPCGDCPGACSNNLCTNACPYNNQYNNCPDLKQQWGCDDSDVSSWCPASCQCPNAII